jgi:formylglycine-generating enzyme required for sulfatase activity
MTQEQWQTVMRSNPSRYKGDLRRPVENVSWHEVQDFLRELAEKEAGKTYRLPTEAEWEYACRAGSAGAYCFGDDEARLREYAWYGEVTGRTTHPVGQLKPNNWGLYDMHGNVWEWVQDWYTEDYYKQRPNLDPDPQGPEKGEGRVLRGGCFWIPQEGARCASRRRLGPDACYDYIGFRIVVRP